MAHQVAAPKRLQGAHEAAPRRSRGIPLRIALVTLAAALLLAVGALTYELAFYSDIYPNIYMDGVALGGQTRAEAIARLETHLRENYADQRLALDIAGQPTVISVADAGLRFQTADAAQQAWDYGRESGFFARIGQIVTSLFGRVELTLDQKLYIDESAVEGIISQAAQQVDIPVRPTETDVTDRAIQVVLGAPGRLVDQRALVELVVDRFLQADFSPLAYTPLQTKPLPVDLAALYSQVYVEPQDARFDTTNPGAVEVVDEVLGVSFDRTAAAAELAAAGPGEKVTIPLLFAPPAVDRAALEARLFIDELASFTTYLNAGNVPRTGNIRLAAGFINGTILLPDDVFSYNGVVGQRTTERGFQPAGAYVQGKLVDEVGGGICQMSTTVYGAALRANLKIVDRSNHSMTVGYVPLGTDATVNWGTTDFKFQNDTGYPIKVVAEQSGSWVKVAIWGTKANDYTVTMESVQLSHNPYEVKTVVNPELAPGTSKVTADGHHGYVVETYRVLKDAQGKLISRTYEAKSRYNRVDQIVEVGPPPPATPPPATDPPPATQPPATDPPPETAPPADPPAEGETAEG